MRGGNRVKRRWITVMALGFMLTGAFFSGIGVKTFLDGRAIRREYPDSPKARDQRNRELAANMDYISMNRELVLANGASTAEAGISLTQAGSFGCVVTIIRDATGEILYESGLIEPGHYIETIHLAGGLKKGYYPCTAIWSFYTEDDRYVGETAWTLVTVIEN